MPTRLIKESIHTSEKLNRLTDFQFRLWVGLLTYVDDYGRGDARLPIIKGAVFPLRERLSTRDIGAALAGLADAGCVVLYEKDGRPYLYLPNWDEHQSIRNKKSKYPAPDGDLKTNENKCLQMYANENSCIQMKTNVPVIQSESNTNPNPKSNTNPGAHAREAGACGPATDPPQKAKRFTPPSLDEVKAYCQERGNRIDAQRFMDHYTSNGWLVGKSPMKDWRAAVRTWERSSFDVGRAEKPPDYQRRSYSDADFRAMEVDLDQENTGI